MRNEKKLSKKIKPSKIILKSYFNSNTMKNTIKIVILLMMTGLFTACQEPQSTEEVLADETQRKEVMQTIVNNDEMMMEMMGVMMNSKDGKMMLSRNKEMMGMMMDNQQMMKDMSKANPDMMQGMMQNMMDMMHQKGMMDDECYENGMNMIKKGIYVK